MFVCFFCKKTFSYLVSFISHIQSAHASFEKELVCGQNKCPRKFSEINAFRKHIKKDHNDLQNIDVRISKINAKIKAPIKNQTNLKTQKNETGAKLNSAVAEEEIPQQMEVNEEPNYQPPDLNIRQIKELLQSSALKFSSELHTRQSLTRKDVQIVIEKVNRLLEDFVDIIKKKIVFYIHENKVEEKSTEEQDKQTKKLDEVLKILSYLTESFDEISTEHRRIKQFKKFNYYITPETVYFGEYEAAKTKNGRTFLGKTPLTGQVIPLRKTLKSFFELPGVFQTAIDFLKSSEKSGNFVTCFVQSSLWKEISGKFENKIVFPLLLYYDDFEINNPLGSHATIHEIGAVYASVPAIPHKFLSKLDNIFLVQLFHSSDRKEVGNATIFKKIIKELKFLEDKGITVQDCDKKYQVYFALALVLGDNKGVNPLLGFNESFNSFKYCRHCSWDKEKCRNMIALDRNVLRSEKNYEDDLKEADPSKTGITEKCIFNCLKSYHVIRNAGADEMHDYREGLCRYGLALIIQILISLKFFTLDELNSRIQYFHYGLYETNKPPLIKKNHLDNKMLIMSSSEMTCLMRYFGLIIGDKVPSDVKAWKLYLSLKKIGDLIMAKEIDENAIQELEKTVQEHHALYKELGEHLKPKHHFFLHYPDLMRRNGPMIYGSSMRYEASHKRFKGAARNVASRVNITATLAIKNQLLFAQRLACQQGLDDVPKFGTLKKAGYLSVSLDEILYKVNETVLVTSVDDILPEFSVLKNIKAKSKNKNDVVFSLQKLVTLSYDDHIDAFQVKIKDSNALFDISFKDLPDVFPTSGVLSYGNTGYKYVCFR